MQSVPLTQNDRSTPWDPNEGERLISGLSSSPNPHVYSVDEYAQAFTTIVSSTPFSLWADKFTTELKSSLAESRGNALSKALALPPEMNSFAQFSMMPEIHNGGVVQPPGFPPEVFRKMVRENLMPQAIINLRVDDILRYSQLSKHPWRPGWRIVMRAAKARPEAEDNQRIMEAERFIRNCNTEIRDARERDQLKYDGFPKFLAKLVRDSLTYDAMCIYTDTVAKGQVRGFKAFPAFSVRLVGPQGYDGDTSIYAVAVDESGKVVHKFTRYDLTFYVRNPRTDPDILSYGYPELEQAVRIIQGFQNAFDMNADRFQRSSIPNGFLVVTGANYTQRQIDVLSRVWQNLKRGPGKNWSVPVLALPEKGEIEVKDLSSIVGQEAYYQDYQNMMAGLFCAIYRFPVDRLGYRISGRGPDRVPQVPNSDAVTGDMDADPGLEPLLGHLETLMNEYILWTRYEDLEFQFTAKNPKEDARAYESRMNCATFGERRAMNDMETLEETVKDKEQKEIAKILDLCPGDPALSGVYQSLIAAKAAPEGKEGQIPTPGARIQSKKDPARSELDHGHASGVRRDSAKEEASANKNK